MSVTKCPSCGYENVPDGSEKCPHCNCTITQTDNHNHDTNEIRTQDEGNHYVDTSRFKPLPPRPRQSAWEKALSMLIMVAGCIFGVIILLRPSFLGIPIMCLSLIPYVFAESSYASRKRAYDNAIADNLEILFPGSQHKPKAREYISHVVFYVIAILLLVVVGSIVISQMPLCDTCGNHCLGLLHDGNGNLHYCFKCFMKQALSAATPH
jgi:hypothetical protein